MNKFLATALIPAAALTLTACSGGNGANDAAGNEAVLSNDDVSSAQENLTVTDDVSGDNVALDNAVDGNAADPAVNGSTGNTL